MSININPSGDIKCVGIDRRKKLILTECPVTICDDDTGEATTRIEKGSTPMSQIFKGKPDKQIMDYMQAKWVGKLMNEVIAIHEQMMVYIEINNITSKLHENNNNT